MKLIFIDIDGTLTIPGENIPPDSAVEAIRKTQSKGNLLNMLITESRYMRHSMESVQLQVRKWECMTYIVITRNL